MTNRVRNFLIAAAAGLALSAGAALAQADDVVERARDQGLVGEQADGYLGFVKPPTGDLKARVDSINIKRRALYTDLAGKRGVTVTEVGAATACTLFANRVDQGEFFRDETGAWRQRAGAPATLPFCAN